MDAVNRSEKRDDVYLDAAPPPLKDALEIIDAKDVTRDEILRVSGDCLRYTNTTYAG